ncbi:hypothetical protein MKW94_001720 [Papaver nudicaule]|uniref:Structure-specific endonuclease subunit SLX1 homolog n=1 Tax=Papaver nudicaule TaxID=74823 RepID=A0AA42B4E6_PAPNU|nr:hypothetical protein [Papaver nudicaule]
MRKRKERTQKARSETLIPNMEERNEEYEAAAAAAEEEEEEEGKGFYACYLLCSLCPRFKGHTYIGFTVNPCRRIRQHNGELTSGAVRTKKKRPWEMMLCIYGFSTKVAALKFEWAWQHPIESLAVREAAIRFKSLSGIANRVKLAFTMLTLPPWQSLKLTVNFFSTAYTNHAAGCPSLPKQMKVQVCSMDELPCYIGDSQISDEIDQEEEWEHEDGENGIGDISQSESSKNISVDNSVAYPNTDHNWERLIEDDGLQRSLLRLQAEARIRALFHVSKDFSFENSVAYPNTDHDWERLIEDDGLQQKIYPEALSTRIGIPDRDVDSSPEALSTRIARFNRSQIVEESTLFELFAETGDNKLGQPTNKILTTTPDASGDQSSPCGSFLRLPEVPSRQPKESLTCREGASLPSFMVGSPLQTPSSSISRFVDTAQAVESRDSAELIKETGCKFGRTRLSSFVVDSPLQPPSSSINRFVDTVQGVKDSDSHELIEGTGPELGRASTQQTTTMTASREDHSPSKTSSLYPPEVRFRQTKKQGRSPLCVLDSPMEKPSSSVIEFPCGLIPKGCVNKMKQANKQQLRTPANDNYDQVASSSSSFHPSPEVEVINLLTPSPDCTIDSFYKQKKRRTLVSRDVIDLTKSPMFVEL